MPQQISEEPHDSLCCPKTNREVGSSRDQNTLGTGTELRVDKMGRNYVCRLTPLSLFSHSMRKDILIRVIIIICITTFKFKANLKDVIL